MYKDTRLNATLTNFRNGLCNHLNLKKRFRKRRTVGWILGSTIPTAAERLQSVSSEGSKRVLHETQPNSTKPLGVHVCFQCYICFATKGAIQRKCSRVRNSIFVNLPHSIGKPHVIPHLYTSFNINDPYFQTKSEIRCNICNCKNSTTKKCCTFITILNELHFYNSENCEKSTKKKRCTCIRILIFSKFGDYSSATSCTSIWLMIYSTFNKFVPDF